MKKTSSSLFFAAIGVISVLFAGCHANETVDCGCGPIQEDEKVTEFSFGVIADVQCADKDAMGSRFYREAKDKLTECAEDMNSQDLAFVVQLGDLIDGSDNSAKDLQNIVAVLNQLHAPVYHVTGNHDFVGIDRKTFCSLTNLNAPLTNLKGGLSFLNEPYRTFAYGGWRFVFLDTMDLAVQGGWDEDSENYRKGLKMLAETADQARENAQEWNGGIGQKQLKWLRITLEHAKSNREKVVVFAHIPVYPAPNVHNLWNSEQIVDVLESYGNVVAYINGHNHAGNYGEKNGIAYITMPGMVEGETQNSYAVVSVDSKGLYIKGQGAVPDRKIAVEVAEK